MNSLIILLAVIYLAGMIETFNALTKTNVDGCWLITMSILWPITWIVAVYTIVAVTPVNLVRLMSYPMHWIIKLFIYIVERS